MGRDKSKGDKSGLGPYTCWRRTGVILCRRDHRCLGACCPLEELTHVARWRLVCRSLGLDQQAMLDSDMILRSELQKIAPAPIQILKVSPVLGLLEGISEILLHLRYVLEVVRHLETLHVWIFC